MAQRLNPILGAEYKCVRGRSKIRYKRRRIAVVGVDHMMRVWRWALSLFLKVR